MNIWPLGKILSIERSFIPGGEGNSVLSNRVTLGTYAIPVHISCSGVVDHRELHNFCVLLFDLVTIRCLFVCLFLLCFVSLDMVLFSAFGF